MGRLFKSKTTENGNEAYGGDCDPAFKGPRAEMQFKKEKFDANVAWRKGEISYTEMTQRVTDAYREAKWRS